MPVSKKDPIRFALILLTLLSLSVCVKAQADRIEGMWYNDVKSAKIQITKENNGKFYGKVVWLKEPLKNGKPKVDEMNVDEKLRTRPGWAYLYWPILKKMVTTNIQAAPFMIP